MEIKDKFVTNITYVDVDTIVVDEETGEILDEGVIQQYDPNTYFIIKKIKQNARRDKNNHYITINWRYEVRKRPRQLSLFD